LVVRERPPAPPALDPGDYPDAIGAVTAAALVEHIIGGS
jgi:hypothetical protein